MILQEKQKEAFDKFKSFPDPKFKYGISLYNNMKELDLNSFDSGGDEEITIEGDAKILDFDNLGDHKEVVEEHLFKTLIVDDKIAALHVAFLKKLILIHVDDELKEPIKITHNLKKGFSSTHVLVIAEKNSKCTIIEKEIGSGFLKSSGVEIFTKEGANVNYVTLQNLQKETWHFSVKKCITGKESNVNWFTASFGSRQSKVEVSTDLAGEGSQTNNLGVLLEMKIKF